MTASSRSAKLKLDEALLALYGDQPQAIVAAIVRTNASAKQYRAEVEAAGLRVRRLFRLIPALAVEGPVADLLALAERPWVTSVSLDREVHTMGATGATDTPGRGCPRDTARSRRATDDSSVGEHNEA